VAGAGAGTKNPNPALADIGPVEAFKVMMDQQNFERAKTVPDDPAVALDRHVTETREIMDEVVEVRHIVNG